MPIPGFESMKAAESANVEHAPIPAFVKPGATKNG
jgi:hypothetical protein